MTSELENARAAVRRAHPDKGGPGGAEFKQAVSEYRRVKEAGGRGVLGRSRRRARARGVFVFPNPGQAFTPTSRNPVYFRRPSTTIPGPSPPWQDPSFTVPYARGFAARHPFTIPAAHRYATRRARSPAGPRWRNRPHRAQPWTVEEGVGLIFATSLLATTAAVAAGSLYSLAVLSAWLGS